MLDGISWNTTFWVDSKRNACMKYVVAYVGKYEYVNCRNVENYIHSSSCPKV
jgi:hypothetical protein